MIHAGDPSRPRLLRSQLPQGLSPVEQVPLPHEADPSPSRASQADAITPGSGRSCPEGHPLTRVTASAAGLECDLCGAVPAGEAFYSCEPCDFDACHRCSGEEGRKRQGRPAVSAAADRIRPGKAARLAVGQAPAGHTLSIALCPAVTRGEAEALRAAAHALGGVKVRAPVTACPTYH